MLCNMLSASTDGYFVSYEALVYENSHFPYPFVGYYGQLNKNKCTLNGGTCQMRLRDVR